MKKHIVKGLILLVGLALAPTITLADTHITDYIRTDTIWTAQNSPYIVDLQTLSILNGITLTVEDGAVVKFVYPDGLLSVSGNLQVNGTAGNGVYFTSYKDDSISGDSNQDGGSTTPAPSDWSGINFEKGSKGDLHGLIMRYAGKQNPVGGVVNKGGIINILDSDLGFNGPYEFYQLLGTTTIDHSSFHDALYCIFAEDGAFAIKNSQISHCGNGLITYIRGTTVDIQSNTFAQNQTPAIIHFGDPVITHSNNTFINNNRNAFYLAGQTTKDETIDSIDGPYISGFSVGSGTTLTLNPGTILKFEKDGMLKVDGTLVAKGIPTNKVYFTSVNDDSVGGDTNNNGSSTVPSTRSWYHLWAINGGKLNLDNTKVTFGGDDPSAGNAIRDRLGGEILNTNGTVDIRNSEITNSFTGLVNENGLFAIASSTIQNNYYGIFVMESSGGVVSGSDISGNTGVGIVNQGSIRIDARNNWWGDKTGPYNFNTNPTGKGDTVWDFVDYLPWLGQLPTNINPVIIIPGILGSAQKNGVWVIDPIGHMYDNLIETLEANGYELDKTLFTFPYDWRNSNADTALLLKTKIDSVKQICGCSKVDIVAHSMGGLVARSYAQSSSYGDDIDKLIFLGTPQRGAPKDYASWEAGEILGSSVPDFFLRYTLESEAKHLGYNNLYDYVHNWPITSVEELLPTYDYLKNASTSNIIHYPSGYPANTFLENLNQGLVHFLSSNIDITNIVGNTGTSTISIIRVVPSATLPLWKDGYPEGFDLNSGDQGLEQGVGDGTVPLTSAKFGGRFDTQIISDHTSLPTESEEEVYQKLTGQTVGTTIKKSSIGRFLFTNIFSPADIVVIAPDGKRVGKDFVTGQEINEIPGAFYSGFTTDDEYVVIPDPLPGKYEIKTIGTGSGGKYTLVSSDISDLQTVEASFTGYTLQNLQTSVSFDITPTSSPIVITPNDITPPVVTITSPQKKDYERSLKLLISASSTDDTGVATSSVVFGNKAIQNNQTIDLFFEKLGTTTVMANATDFQGNIGSSTVSLRIIATGNSTLSDVERLFQLGSIYKKMTKDYLMTKIKAMIRTEKGVQIIDKKLAKALLLELEDLKREKINQQAYTILKEDLEWLINN